MRIAAIIPAYNSAHFLKGCIDSVLQQTCPLAEIIVVDDGSRDNTREIVESYPPDRVRYFWRPNGGLSAARNTGVQQTTSPWVGFLDADDRWEPRKIELQQKALAANPAAVLCYTGKLVALPDGRRAIADAFPAGRLWPRMRYENNITPSTVIMRRDVLEAAGGFDEKLRACEDWDLWVRLGPQCKMVAVHEPVTWYRMSDSSMSMEIDRMLTAVTRMLETSLPRGLNGFSRWTWLRRAWSAELSRAAISARKLHDPRRLSFLLRSLAVWPSPFFLSWRWKALLLYALRPFTGRRPQ
jgi:glycosyltransferase involved in cell wall biosynthesis